MKQSRLREFFTDRRLALLIRWWAAGAVYFFIGWGTFLGNQRTVTGFVLTLGLVLGLFNILVVNPGLRLMFNIAPRRPAHENTYSQKMSDHLVELIKSIFIVFNIAVIYQVINQFLVAVRELPADAVPLPGEPILFGLFYVIVFWYLELIVNKIKEMILRIRDMGKEQ
jgi:hypothetical protein